MRARNWSAYLLLVVMAAGCSNPTTPPSPVPSTPTGLIIDGVRALEEGETAALTLSVSIPGGASKAVAADALVTWSSSNKAIATVSDRGVVTAVRTGKADISAAFDQLRATATVTITPGPRIFPGLVRQIPDRIGVQATITAADSRGVTQTVESDRNGHFLIRLPNGPARLTVKASGYETSDMALDISSDTSLRLGLLPVGSGVRERLGVAWEDWPGGGPLPPVGQASLSFVVNQPGMIRTHVDACVLGCYASEMALLCAEIRDGRNRVLSSTRGFYDQGPWTPNFATQGGERYEIKIGVCPEFAANYLMKRYYID